MIVFLLFKDALDYLVMFVLICMKVNLAQINRYKNTSNFRMTCSHLSSCLIFF